MNACDLIDRYRDGELDERRRRFFELHLSGCSECRFSLSILNNLVRSLNQRRYDFSPIEAQQIARHAGGQIESWDFQVISWLRPIPAWTTLVLALAFYSGIRLFSPDEARNPIVEYETLVRDMESKGVGKQQPQFQSEAELFRWLEQQRSRP